MLSENVITVLFLSEQSVVFLYSLFFMFPRLFYMTQCISAVLFLTVAPAVWAQVILAGLFLKCVKIQTFLSWYDKCVTTVFDPVWPTFRALFKTKQTSEWKPFSHEVSTFVYASIIISYNLYWVLKYFQIPKVFGTETNTLKLCTVSIQSEKAAWSPHLKFLLNDGYWMNSWFLQGQTGKGAGSVWGEITYWFFWAMVPHWFNIHRHTEAGTELCQSPDTFLPYCPRHCGTGSSMIIESSGFF